jgi:DNA repair exonuclease SbcCD nuclease subunit
MRLIHASDLQIGMVFRYFEPDVAAVLQDARQAIVKILGECAIGYRASAVLLAGDIYDKQQLSTRTLAQPIEAMRQFPRVVWHLLPGNHDCARDNGLWHRLRGMGLPENVRLHTEPGAAEIANDDGVPVFLLPAPLHYASSGDDLTAYMDAVATPAGSIRIGVAHGSVRGFGSEGEASNYIAPDRAETAGLAYLALGDWHRQIRVDGRTWYSGTPEPDQFKLPPGDAGTLCNGGGALLVDIPGAGAPPIVTPVETGRYKWHRVFDTLLDEARIDSLEGRLRGLDRELDRVVLDLRVTGTLSLAGRKRFEDRIVVGVGAALRAMRLDDRGIVLEPTEADLDEIDRSGFVRVAADRLKSLQDDAPGSEQARLAALALRRLYLEHLRGMESP